MHVNTSARRNSRIITIITTATTPPAAARGGAKVTHARRRETRPYCYESETYLRRSRASMHASCHSTRMFASRASRMCIIARNVSTVVLWPVDLNRATPATDTYCAAHALIWNITAAQARKYVRHLCGSTHCVIIPFCVRRRRNATRHDDEVTSSGPTARGAIRVRSCKHNVALMAQFAPQLSRIVLLVRWVISRVVSYTVYSASATAKWQQ